jgi:AraC-like DNA-binding protein
MLLTSINIYQKRKNEIQSWSQQSKQSTLALKNHFVSTLDQIENIALIIQFSQQTKDVSGINPTAAEQALEAYQYMQFLNTVQLGYPVVHSVWTIRDGYVLSSDRTRYQADEAAVSALLSDTQWSGWIYPFQPQRLIGEIENGPVCLTYLARIWDTKQERNSIVAINVSASCFYQELLEMSGLSELLILDQNNQIIMSAEDGTSADRFDEISGFEDGLGENPQYAMISDGKYTLYGYIAPEDDHENSGLQLLYPLLVLTLSLSVVIAICYAISKRISSPLCALLDRFQSNAASMDNQTTMIVKKSLESMVKYDYLSRGEENAAFITQEYRKLMDEIVTPQMIESLQLTEQYVVLTLGLDEPLHQNGNAERLMPYFEKYVRSCLRNMVKENEKIYTVYIHDSLVAAAVMLNSPSRFDEIDAMMFSLQEMLKAVSPCDVSIACSALHSDQAEIRKAMAEALEAIRWKLMRSPGCHIFYEERMDAPSRFTFPKAKLQRVLSSLDKEQLQTVLDNYHSYLSTVMEAGASVDDLMLACYQMLGRIVQVQIQRGIATNSIFMENADSPYRYMSSLEFSDHISDWLEKKITLLWEHCQTTSTVGNAYINNFRDYMKKHFMEDLQPEHVAEEIGISYSYLRRLLSKELNTSFSAYLLTLRLAQTKELLRTTQLAHKEIAEQVGFGSEQTLYRVFRQNEGCSPKEWRRTAMTSLSGIETTNPKKEGD